MKNLIKLFVIGLVMVRGLGAQSLNVEAGIARVKNFHVQQMYGVSLFIKLNDRVSWNLAYRGWGGGDGEYEDNFNRHGFYSADRYYDNFGTDFLLFYRVLRTGGFSMRLGSGFGRYEEKTIDISNVTHYFHRATFSHALLLLYDLNNRLSVCFRGTVSMEKFFDPPAWRLFNLGLVYHFSDRL